MARDPEPFPLPSHAYVPGQNARHPEDWFDQIKASVTPDLATADLHLTAAWRAGRYYLAMGYFWESHEVLEAVWMQAPEGTPEREMVQALIQLANARLKLRMARDRAAFRLCDMVEKHLARCSVDDTILGLDVGDMLDEVKITRQLIISR